MMEVLVIDASVAVPLVRPERESAAIRVTVARWLRAGHRLVVPSHFWLDVLNVLGRRHQYTSAEIVEALRELDELDLETLAVGRPVQFLIVDLMGRFRLTSYDGAYLALAHAMDAGLATLDADLAEAAGARWVSPLDVDGRRRLSESHAAYRAEVPVAWPQWSGAGAYLAELRARALAGRTS